MRTVTLCAFSWMTLTLPAIAECYHNPGDPTETIREVEETGALIWEHAGKRVEFETGSGGTGVGYRIAFDPRGNGFRYEFDGDDLIFGGVRYVKGCD